MHWSLETKICISFKAQQSLKVALRLTPEAIVWILPPLQNGHPKMGTLSAHEHCSLQGPEPSASTQPSKSVQTSMKLRANLMIFKLNEIHNFTPQKQFQILSVYACYYIILYTALYPFNFSKKNWIIWTVCICTCMCVCVRVYVKCLFT